MKKSILFLKLILVCVFLVLAYNSAFPDRTVTSINWEGQELEAISGEFVIQLNQGVDYSDLNNLLSQNNCWIEDSCNLLRFTSYQILPLFLILKIPKFFKFFA